MAQADVGVRAQPQPRPQALPLHADLQRVAGREAAE